MILAAVFIKSGKCENEEGKIWAYVCGIVMKRKMFDNLFIIEMATDNQKSTNHDKDHMNTQNKLNTGELYSITILTVSSQISFG